MHSISALFPILILISGFTTRAAAQSSTVDPARSLTWAANTGFINWRPGQPQADSGAVFNEYFLSGKIYSANCGWIDLGDGTPNDAIHYSNAFGFDCGINADPLTGKLTGFAWSANTGWINFEQTYGKPVINTLTGTLSGFAWSPNTGWINLGGNQLATKKINCPDFDGDGMADAWERDHFGDVVTAGALTDSDGDGITDANEYRALTDPLNPASGLKITGTGFTRDDGENLNFQELVFGSTVPTRLYTVQQSTDLISWSNVSGLVNFPGDAGSTTRYVTVPGDWLRCFFRIEVRKPLP